MAAVLKSDAIFDSFKRFLETSEGQKLKHINLVYQFHIAPEKLGIDEAIYTIDLKNGEVIKGPYEGGKPDATVSIKDEDIVKFVNGKFHPKMALMRGDILVEGSISAPLKLKPDMFPKPSKM